MATLAEIYKAAGMLPPITDPSKASLPLDPPKPSDWQKKAAQTVANSTAALINQNQQPINPLLDSHQAVLTNPTKQLDTNFMGVDLAGSGIDSKIMRGVAGAGGRLVSTANYATGNNLFDPEKIDKPLQFLERMKEDTVNTNVSPTRKRELDALKEQTQKAQGFGMVPAVANTLLDTVTHPSEWTAQGSVENILDPANIAGAGLGGLLGRQVLSTAGKVTLGATGGAIENAGINAAEESMVAGGRGQSSDDIIKAGVGGAIGGTLMGAPIGGVAGGLSRYKPNRIDEHITENIINHESNQQTIMDNALMQTPEGEKFDPNVDIGMTRDPIAPTETIDMPEMVATPPVVDHRAMFSTIIAEDLDAARAEHDTVIYPKVMEMAQAGAKPEQISAYLDNAITPTRDDLSLSESINGGEMMASRLSGMRIMDVLERSIKTSVEAPDIARTNEEVKTYLKKNGVGKELSSAFVKAYATKDPAILHEHILKNTESMQAEVKNQIDTRLTEYATLKEQQKAAQWEASVPPEAVDLVTHPKFLEHLDERKDISAADTRYAQTRTADLVLSHENNGQGYETVVQQPAMFERNYNADFELTKKDVADIKAGKWSEPLVQKLRNDLERRDNDPLYNPENNSEMLVNNSYMLVDTPSQRLMIQMEAARGTDEAAASMAILEGRARAMDISVDEMIVKHPLEVRDMTGIDGVDYVDAINEFDGMFQKEDGDIVSGEELQTNVNESVKKSLEDSSYNEPIDLGYLSNEAIQKMKQFTGLDLTGYKRVMLPSEIRHTRNEHPNDLDVYNHVLDIVENFDFAVKAMVFDKKLKKKVPGFRIFRKLPNELVEYVEVRKFDGKKLELKSVYRKDLDVVMRDPELPLGLRLWADADYRSKQPQPSRHDTDSVGFDGSKATDTEILLQKDQNVKLSEDQINGMIELGVQDIGNMKAIITLFKTADASTLPHELMHWMEKTLSDVERAAVDDILKNVAEGTPRSEALARMFEKYLAEGEAPTPELKGAFEKMRDWLTALFESIIHNKDRDFPLTDSHRELYRALLGDKDAAAKLSERYDGIVQEQIRAEAEVLFQKVSVDSRNALQKMNDAYDGIIDTIFDKTGRALRGVDKNGDISEVLYNGNFWSIEAWSNPINLLDLTRRAFTTNIGISDTLVDMAHEFDNVRGYLSDEAKALRDILTQYDKVKIIDPLQTANLLEQDAPPRMTTHGALLVRALGGDLPLSMLPESMHVVYAQMRKVIDDNTKALIDAGELSPEHAKDNYLKRYYMEHITNKNLGSGKITQTGKHARSELDLDTRLDLGQIEDAAFVITRTMLDQRLQLEKAMYFKKLSDKFGIDEARDGYAQISKKMADDGKTPLYGALAGKYVPKFVADDIKGAYEVGSWVDSIVKGLAVPVDFIKVTQTVKNPGTHVYNVTSNTYIAYMDGHLSDVAEIAMMIKRNPKKFKAITKAASKEGLNGMGVDLEKSILKANTDGKGLTIIKNLLLAQDSKSGEFTRNAYDWEDKIFKLAKFYSEMKKNGGKLDDASAKQYMSEVHKIYVDHSTPMPKWIRNLDKSGLSPFLSYVWRSAPQVAYVTLKHPLRFAAFHAVLAPFGASAIWNAIGGDDEDETGKPKYMKEGGFNMMGTENFLNIGTDENGFDSYINLGRAAPGMRFMPDKGNPFLLYSDGGFTTDILRTMATGESNKGKVYNQYDSNTEKTLKMTAAIAEYVLPPVLPVPAVPVIMGDKIGDSGTKQLEKDGTVKQETVSIGGRYAQKLNQALMGKRDSYGQPVTVGDVVSQAVGMKVTRIDPKVEKEKRYEEWMPEVKRAINEGDIERAKEYADKIKELDLPDKEKGEKDPKREAQKDNKKDMDQELQKLGLQKPKSSIGFKMPHIGPPALKF